MICINKPESVFLFFGFVFGTIILFITPPFQVPDEAVHFYRAISITQGDLVAEVQNSVAGGVIPENAFQTGAQLAIYLACNPQNKQSFEKLSFFLNLPPEPDKKRFVKNHSMYPPAPYLAQAFGIGIGKVLHLSWLRTMYIARFTTLMFWLLCTYIAIKIIPVSKWLLILLALSPMALFQAASLSADSPTNALSFLFIALLFKNSVENELDNRKLITTLILCILVSLCKPIYISLIFLFFLTPVNRVKIKKYGAAFTLILLSSAGLIMLWMYLIKDVYTAFHTWRALPPEQVVSSSEQVKFILSHPLQYLGVMLNTTRMHGTEVLESFVGKLGWIDTPLPRWLLFLHSGMLLFYALTDSNKDVILSYWQKVVISVVFFGTVVLTYTSIYMTWTLVGNPTVEGLQGRYFIPIGILFFLLFYNRRLHIKPDILGRITVFYVPLMLTTVLIVLINRYYVQLF